MNEQESIRTYEKKMPEMPQGAIPVHGGLNVLRESDPEDLRNPLPHKQSSIDRGKRAYGYFCVMCHGPNGRGYGTVGQSFYPLPTNLRSADIQDQTDNEIFYSTTFGLNRMPPLGYTASKEDRWAVLHYIRSLGREPAN